MNTVSGVPVRALVNRLHFLGCALLLFSAVTAVGDENLKKVQDELKNQGFFYGEVNGQGGAETTAAIRRYQIRNGLEVTGALNKETLASLRVGGGSPAGTQSRDMETVQNSDLRSPDRTVVDSDKSFLKRQDRSVEVEVEEAPPEEMDADAPPARVLPPSADPDANLSLFYARTPYERAPFEVQLQTLKRAQAVLAQRGFYDGPLDGILGPGTQQAVIRFQNDASLRRTGRLDLSTLDELELLPGRRASPYRPYRRPEAPPGPGRRAYRGVWVR